MKSLFLILLSMTCFLTHAFANTFTSSLKDQTQVEVTVYNSHLGLVKDVRKLKLPEGQGEVRFEGVASNILPVTVHVKALENPEAFSILEQNYEYDLMNQNKLLDKFVGKEVKLLDNNYYQDRQDITNATLLSNNNGQIFRIEEEIYLGHPGIKILPEIPENLIAKPTLMWLYSNQNSKEQEIEVSYLTNGIHWKADYVMVLNEDDTEAGLSGWVSLDNQSGTTYQNAKLKLVAGDVNRVRQNYRNKGLPMVNTMMMETANDSFEEKSFFEYHIYDLQRQTTIKDKQTKQISLLETSGVQIEKEYFLYGTQNYYNQRARGKTPKQVEVYVSFQNEKENALGMPLPAGTIRLYKADPDDSLQFIGEDQIQHTPKNEEVTLKIGKAFDVKAERVQTDFKQITKNRYETEWEITLRNHKEEAISVNVIESIPWSWKILDASHDYEKETAQTIRFTVPVKKDDETKITYRVQVGY